MELNEEESKKQAEVLIDVLFAIIPLDVEYMTLFANTLKSNAIKYDSMAVLNKQWKQSKSELMYAQAEAASLICRYKTKLKEIDKLKEKVKQEDADNKFIESLFV